MAAAVATVGLVISVAGPAAAAPGGDDPAAGSRSNMGLCSAYLAGLDAPRDPTTGDRLGGNARSGVNLVIKIIGPALPDHLDTPGELYRIRAREHPDAPAEQECLPRPPV